MNHELLLVGSMGLWTLALARSLWLAFRPQLRAVGGRPRSSARQRWRWRSLRRNGAAHSIRLARRLSVALGSGGSLARSLAVVIAAEPEGPLRQALQSRLRYLQQQAPPSQLPRWQGMPLVPCPPALRVLDDLLLGRITVPQALSAWRIELLCSCAASFRADPGANATPAESIARVARRRGDQ